MRDGRVIPRVDEEVADFIAAESPRKVLAFQPSALVKARMAELVAREKAGILTMDEASELEHSLLVEHMMHLAKVCARKYLRHS